MCRLFDFDNYFKQQKVTLETEINNTKTTSNTKNDATKVE